MTKKLVETPESKAGDLLALVERTSTRDASRKDVAALRAKLRETPGLWRSVGDLSDGAIFYTLGNVSSSAIRESVKQGVEEMRAGLGYKDANVLEQILIDQVLVCWVRMSVEDVRYSAAESMTLEKGRYFEQRLSATQRRYLRAVETLVRVSRLISTTPTLQINIANVQVNNQQGQNAR